MNWDQFRAILWLRWCLTKNQLARQGGLGKVIAALAGVMMILPALGCGLGATLLGIFAFRHLSPTAAMYLWDVIMLLVLLFSLVGIVVELQRSESIDLSRLLHLPIGLKQVFVFNYLASLVSLHSIIVMAVMLGLTLGLTISNGFRFLLLVPIVCGFAFMASAWIYCLRGWLVSLMVNPRRRRSVIMWVTLSVVLIGQAPQVVNLVVQRQIAHAAEESQKAAKTPGKSQNQVEAQQINKWKEALALAENVHPWVPVLWVGNGAHGAASGNAWPAVWGAAGLFALGWLGLVRAYRTTLRFYRAEGSSAAAKQSRVPVETSPSRNWVEARLPWLPEDVAAIALAQCRSMTRAPEVRMMLIILLIVMIVAPAPVLFGNNVSFPDVIKPFVPALAMVLVFFSSIQLICNQFGIDRDGFRGLVLLPTPRARLLLGKNLALLPLIPSLGFLIVVGVCILTKLSVWLIIASAFQFTGALLLMSIIGNLASILVPYRIAAGSLKPTKLPWKIQLVMFFIYLLFPILMLPVLIPPALGLGLETLHWLPATPVNLIASLGLACVMVVLYVVTLPPLGRLLQQREIKILAAVTEVGE